MLHKSLYVICLLCLMSVPMFAAGDEAPAWLRQLSTVTPPVYEKDVPAVVLLDEQTTTLDSDGKLTMTQTYAIKVLVREGKELAYAHATYLTNWSKVKEMKGWLIRADGSVKKYDKDNILDLIEDPDDVYNETRFKLIDASNEADTGAIFGYQVVTEEKPLFTQDIFLFQGRLPTLVSRYTLSLPQGWKAVSTTFNRASVEPSVSGSSYTWELRNLPPIPPEPASPSVRNLAPRIAVNYFPTDSAKNSFSRTFSNWTEVSRWTSDMHDPQAILDDNIAVKARELTANAKTEFEKIRAIGTFVQNIQYISIDIGVGAGNGMRPRPSTLVLSRGYGDCKDKATLMRALLKALKIEAYPIAIFSGDPTYVREEWASPGQFNHCIIAVKVSDETQSPTVINHPALGRLLIFDATDPYTPVGDLPDYLQGSYALIAAGDKGGLYKMPVTPPESNMLDRLGEIKLDENGGISGIIKERATGQYAATFRREFRETPLNEYTKVIERWVTRGVTAAKVGKVTPVDRPADARFDLDLDFNAAAYGQLMQGRLLVFKPVVVARRDALWLTEPKRNHPIQLDSNAFSEKMVFKLPAGFTVDETPDALNLDTPFGKYSTSYEVKDGQLIFSRKLVVNQTTVSVDKYEAVRGFYTKIRNAEQSPVVLIKK